MSAGYINGRLENAPVNEATATPSLSTKSIYIPAISFDPGLNPNSLERDDELRGLDDSVLVTPEIFAPTWSIETRMYPDLLGFMLAAQLGMPTTTAGNGVITDPDGTTVPT